VKQKRKAKCQAFPHMQVPTLPIFGADNHHNHPIQSSQCHGLLLKHQKSPSCADQKNKTKLSSLQSVKTGPLLPANYSLQRKRALGIICFGHFPFHKTGHGIVSREVGSWDGLALSFGLVWFGLVRLLTRPL